MNENGLFLIRAARLIGVLAFWVVSSQGPAHAQLAITEVMSQASTNRGAAWVGSQSDFWELTNFGTNAIDVTGYTFSDNKLDPPNLLVPTDEPLIMRPGQSVVFVRTESTTNGAQFRAWWGECLNSNVPVRFYPRAPGFDENFDGIRLWDTASNLVDRIYFGVARRGVTFMSDTNTGEFGVYSQLEACGACRAEMADDIGSPGMACERIPLQIVQQPTNQTACAGAPATFTARAIGLPRAKYQWFYNGIVIPGATAASYTVTNATPSRNGSYHVDVSNGLMLFHSAPATLAVSTNPSAPVILSPPADFELYSNQTARFSVTVCAFPPASYQWFSNGVPLVGATNPVLLLPNCTPAMSGAEICVRVQNSLGTNIVCARLIVTPRPELRITEIMASTASNCVQHADWFEVTNYGTNSVNLLGYRFSDYPTLEGAFVVTQAVSLLPGRSAVFVEGMSAAEFSQWWAAGNLPPGLPIITYTGMGLSGELGDALYLWNAAATEDDSDPVESKSFASAMNGISVRFGFDESDCYFGCESAVSEFGAFRALECDDIGSPGYTANSPPRLVSIARDAFGASITWHAVEGKTYRLEYNPVPQASGWMSLGDTVAADSLPTKTDTSATGVGQRFYRVVQLTP
jgi:hypothetical protein